MSGLVVVPPVWILARLLHTESGSVKFLAAPIILAWFAARGWKTEDCTWPRRLPLWKFIPKFLLATLVVLGPPLVIYSIGYGCIILLKIHNPRYLLVAAYIGLTMVSALLIWIGRHVAFRLTMSALGLTHATTCARMRFAFYWLVSLSLVALAIRA